MKGKTDWSGYPLRISAFYYNALLPNKNFQTDKLTKPWNVAAPQPTSLSIAAEAGVMLSTSE